MHLPVSDILIKRMITLARTVTLDAGVRILVPYPDDVFLVDAVHKYISRDLTVSTLPYGKYDLIMCYRPLPFNQEQETLTDLYTKLKTNGRLIALALDTSLKVRKEQQERFVRWLRNIEAYQEDLPAFSLDSKKGSLLIIDRLEIVEEKVIEPVVRRLRTAKYRDGN